MKRPLSAPLKALLLVGLFVLPAALFYIMVYGGYHRVKRLRFYGPHRIEWRRERGQTFADTLYYQVPVFSGEDLAGNIYKTDSLKGYVSLVQVLDGALFNSLPKEIVYFGSEALGTFPQLRMLTVFRNQAPRNFNYPWRLTSKLANDSLRWHFMIMEASECDSLVYRGLFASLQRDSLAYDPAGMVLLDKEQHIRGYYNPLLLKDLENMKKEIQHLYREYELAFKTHTLVRIVD